MEDMVIDVLYLIVPYCDEFVLLLGVLIFVYGIFDSNKKEKKQKQNNNSKLVKTEYSLSTQGNKKYRIRKIYIDKTTGKTSIVDEYTNEEIFKNKYKGN